MPLFLPSATDRLASVGHIGSCRFPRREGGTFLLHFPVRQACTFFLLRYNGGIRKPQGDGRRPPPSAGRRAQAVSAQPKQAGEARLGGETIAGWTITPLEVRDADPEALEFEALGPCNTPCFRRGQFDRAAHEGAVYLDVSGWGMGEVWINGHYLGSFWDEEKQQSILIPAEILAEKGNRIVVFDLKNNDPGATMRLSDKPVFK